MFRRRPPGAARRLPAVLLLLLCMLVVACSSGGVVAATSGTGSVGCPQEFGSFSTGHWPPACWRPYGAGSPFNTDRSFFTIRVFPDFG